MDDNQQKLCGKFWNFGILVGGVAKIYMQIYAIGGGAEIENHEVSVANILNHTLGGVTKMYGHAVGGVA